MYGHMVWLEGPGTLPYMGMYRQCLVGVAYELEEQRAYGPSGRQSLPALCIGKTPNIDLSLVILLNKVFTIFF